jgi:hypothetical protein
MANIDFAEAAQSVFNFFSILGATGFMWRVLEIKYQSRLQDKREERLDRREAAKRVLAIISEGDMHMFTSPPRDEKDVIAVIGALKGLHEGMHSALKTYYLVWALLTDAASWADTELDSRLKERLRDEMRQNSHYLEIEAKNLKK